MAERPSWPTVWARLRGAVALGCLLLAADGRAGTVAAQQLAQASEQRSFDIPAQSLAGALTAFGQQSGLQVTFDAGMAAGLSSPGVSGRFSAEEALRRLLAGTPVTYQFTDGRTVALQRAAASGATALGPVTVEARRTQETATGPVQGYVATRSATGTKTDTPLIETPQSISVVTKEQIAAQGARNVDQALRYTAGVVTETAGADNRFDIATARGFALDQYQNGLKLVLSNSGFAVPQVDPYGLERIEVLRGPASVLYGQASPGGIVNLVSKRPTEEPLREIMLATGTDSRKQGAFDFSGPIDANGTWLFRLTGLGYNVESQVEGTEYERFFIAPALTWRPSADTNLTLLLNYQADPKAGFFNKFPAVGTAIDGPVGQIPRTFYAGEPGIDKFDRTTMQAGYAFEHTFNDTFAVRQNFRYLRMETDLATIFAGATLGGDGRTIPRSSFFSNDQLDTISLDNQLQAKFATGPLGHTAILGLDYQKRTFEQLARGGAAPPIDFLNPIYGRAIPNAPVTGNAEQRQDQLGFYAQDQVKFGGFSLLAGLRGDLADSETENRLTRVTTVMSDSAVTGRVGLVYLFDNGIAPYASFTESFQPTVGTDFFGTPFTPTTGQQYEVGVKYQPQGVNASLLVSAYDLTQQNVLTPDPLRALFSVQTGEINSRGFEIEGKAQLAEGFGLLAAYAYVDATVTKANNNTVGKQPVGVPTHLASLWADYAVREGELNGLSFGVGARYRGSSFGNGPNTMKIPGVGLFDAALSYDLGALRPDLAGAQVALNISNILDKDYIARCQDNGCYYGLRRAVLLTLSYKW